MKKSVKILDSNVLLDYPQIITKEEEYWIISYRVLEEIDGLKRSANHETGIKARKAAVYISKNMHNIEFDMQNFTGLSTDDALLELTKERKGILITNDVALKVKATVNDVLNEGYTYDDDYTGIVYMNTEDITEEEYNAITAELWETGKYFPEDYIFSPNEFLIIPPLWTDSSTKTKESIFRFDDEQSKFVPVKPRPIKNNWTGEVFPRNAEQQCLVDALLNDKIKIIYAGGVYGSGKTYLTHNYAIRELEAERIKKIIYVPNNSYTENTMDLGALPGDLMEKILPSIGPLVDLVGIDQIHRYLSEDKLEVVPVAYIRGRSFNDAIVLVSEAENLTEDHIKLLLARCGENTKIFFDGDIHQADSAIFKDRNGLKLLLSLHEDRTFGCMFATTHFVKIERSAVAAAADYLDKK